MAFANVQSFLYIRSEPTTDSEWVGKLYPDYAAKITGPVGEWTKVESGNVTGYVYSRYITVGNEAQKKAEELVQNNDTGNAEDAFTYAESREVAVRAKAFGMEILAYDPYMPAEKIEADGARAVDLDTMLSESDMVSIHLPVLDSTKGMVNKDWFSKMKPTAIVINTARAAVIDQKDFVEALQNGTIAGAAIDVYWQEPVPANHPLLKMRNVVCTPHMAGITTDVDNWSGEMMSQEVLAYLKGEDRKYIWRR